MADDRALIRVPNNTKLRNLTLGERDQLDSIASRHKAITAGTADADQRSLARLHADISHLLRIIGGDYAEIAEDL